MDLAYFETVQHEVSNGFSKISSLLLLELNKFTLNFHDAFPLHAKNTPIGHS